MKYQCSVFLIDKRIFEKKLVLKTKNKSYLDPSGNL